MACIDYRGPNNQMLIIVRRVLPPPKDPSRMLTEEDVEKIHKDHHILVNQTKHEFEMCSPYHPRHKEVYQEFYDKTTAAISELINDYDCVNSADLARKIYDDAVQMKTQFYDGI